MGEARNTRGAGTLARRAATLLARRRDPGPTNQAVFDALRERPVLERPRETIIEQWLSRWRKRAPSKYQDPVKIELIADLVPPSRCRIGDSRQVAMPPMTAGVRRA